MIIIPRRIWRYPMSYERQYRKQLVTLVDTLNSCTKAEYPALKEFLDDNRMDDISDRLTGIIDRIKESFYALISADFIQQRIQGMFDWVSSFNETEFIDIIREVLRVDIFQSEPELDDMKDLWVKDNVNLITSIQSTYFDRIEAIISDAVRNGSLWKDVAEQIRQLAGVSERRAQLIAVDQIGKLNGQLTKYRQTRAGIEEYIWRTAGDSRVRPDHVVRNGRKYRWSNPPWDGHPGQPIRCRCVAIPVIDTEKIHISGVRVRR